MTMDKIANIAAAIVTVALVSVIVTGGQSAAVIGAFGSAFSGAIKAAKG